MAFNSSPGDRAGRGDLAQPPLPFPAGEGANSAELEPPVPPLRPQPLLLPLPWLCFAAPGAEAGCWEAVGTGRDGRV